MPQAEAMGVLLAGASGFLGGRVLEALLDAPEVGRVIAVTRRPLKREHPRLANRIVPFERLEEQLAGVSCHAAVCCIGAARGLTDPGALRTAELELPLAFARVARAARAQRFVLLSSFGAGRRARAPREQLKGELEDEVAALGFDALDILQPGPVTGLRKGMTARDLALLAILPLFDPLRVGRGEGLRSLPALTLGLAVAGALRSGRRGLQRYPRAGILQLAKLKPARRATPTPADAPAGRR